MIYIDADFQGKSYLHNVRLTLEDDHWYAETTYCQPALEHLNATEGPRERSVVEGTGWNMEEAIRDLDDNLHDAYEAITSSM